MLGLARCLGIAWWKDLTALSYKFSLVHPCVALQHDCTIIILLSLTIQPAKAWLVAMNATITSMLEDSSVPEQVSTSLLLTVIKHAWQGLIGTCITCAYTD